ncbi:YbhN family protein [Corynebacterium choanae]|uniref:TIGR00374 family protein n=1 Tax=Corynebacterium choanae TaxID=1862358 RepID=A0A3G6J3D5_9CORY|nr:YbhN family protein [Corynebacterium choanae]AZA12581.1 hypothetical protein CCHOA_00760 [Corynebacterium choanae]
MSRPSTDPTGHRGIRLITCLQHWWAKPWVKWLTPFAVFTAVAIALNDRAPMLKQGLAAVAAADRTGVLLSYLLSCVSLVCMGEVMRILLAAGGIRPAPWRPTALVFAANAWSTSLPGGQAIATVLSFNAMRSWGASVALCSWQIVFSGAMSTIWLLGLGLMSITNLGSSIPLWSIIPATLTLTGLLAALWWATHHPRHLIRWARRLLSWWNRLWKQDRLQHVDTVTNQIRQLGSVELSKRVFISAGLLSLGNWILDVVALSVCIGAVTGQLPALHADSTHTTIAGVIVAYVSSKIAGTVQATPGGLGPVEAVMTAALVAVGMTAAGALGAVFVYRMTSFLAVTATGWLIHLMVYAKTNLVETTQTD